MPYGPPIVIFMMDLLSNIANVHFSFGDFAAALKWYDMCWRLTEEVFEEFPLPDAFAIPIYNETAEGESKIKKKGSVNSLLTEIVKLRLSYLHRSTLLAQGKNKISHPKYLN